MKLINSIRRLFVSLYKSIKRFPVTICLTTAVAVMAIIIVEISKGPDEKTGEMLTRAAMAAALGIPVSLFIKFTFERIEKASVLVKTSLYLVSAVFLVLYYLFLLPNFEMVPMTRYIALSIAFYLAALVAPYYYNRDNFELYVIRLIVRFIITLVFSSVLQAGISAILATINILLGVNIYSNLYIYMWIGIVGIFAPIFFLGGVPSNKDEFTHKNYPGVLKVLFLYIVLPIISVYTLILYIYFAKIVITLQWPVGMVGNLVLWYSVISALVIFLLSPISLESKWAKNFIFWFPKLVLPLLVIMFVSVGIRVRAYGITENRYFVIILGLWVLGVMLYWNLSRTKRNIILLVLLAAVAFFSVWGPWSAYSISEASQNYRFKSIISKYDMIDNGRIVKPNTDIPKNDQKEINEILLYFEKSHSLKDIKYLPADFKLADMKKIFGFEYQEYSYGTGDINYFTYSLNTINSPIDIMGYDYWFSFRYPGNTNLQSNQNIKAEYNTEKQELKITYNGTEVYKGNLSAYGDKLFEKYGAAGDTQIVPEDMIFTDENNKVKIKLLLVNVNGSRDTALEKTEFSSIDFDLLVKIK